MIPSVLAYSGLVGVPPDLDEERSGVAPAGVIVCRV
jgi:hypothetical protein